MGVWLPHSLSEYRYKRLKIGLYDNVQCKCSGLTMMNLRSQLQRRSFKEEKLCCEYGRVTMVLFISNF